MPKLLVIVKDESLNRQIVDDLTAAGFEAKSYSGAALPAAIDADIILLDMATAVRWAAKLKSDSQTADLPLISLATEPEIADDILGFLDDLIFTPIITWQLITRVKRLLIKAGKVEDKNRIRVGALLINLESYEVSINREVVELTYKEYELLKYLAGHPGRVYNRQTLLNQIWEYDYFGGTRTVDVHIRRLRAKLGSKYGSMIQTVRHVGYRFSSEEVTS